MRRSIAGGWGVILGLFMAMPGAVAHGAPLPSAAASAPITISGRVTTRTGTPIAGTVVEAHSTDFVSPTPAAIATTEADGRYTLTIPTAIYGQIFSGALPAAWHFDVTLCAPDGQYAEPSEDTVTARVGQSLTGSDFLLTDGPQITVHVQDAITGAPVPGMTVAEQNYNGPPADRPAPVVTNAQGIAIVTYKPPSVNLELTAPGGRQPTVGPAPGYEFYYQESANPPQDTTWDVKTYSLIPPEPDIKWQVKVLTPEGKSAVGAIVEILRGNSQYVGQTDKAGIYSRMMPPMASDEYNRGNYETDAVFAHLGDSTGVLVPTPDETMNEMTVSLIAHSAAKLSGTVVDTSGKPEAGVTITAFGWIGESNAGRSWTADSGGVSGPDGRFIISNLPPGRYEVEFSGSTYSHISVPPMSRPGERQDTLLLKPGDDDNIGAVVVPPANHVLYGQVVSDKGVAINNADCHIVGAHTNSEATTNADGDFTAFQIVDEPLTCTVSMYFPQGLHGIIQKQVTTVAVPAGSLNVRIVIPTTDLPLPLPQPVMHPAPPVVARPSPPASHVADTPHVAAASGKTVTVGWVSLQIKHQGPAADLQPASFTATVTTAFHDPQSNWTGPLSEIDGATMVVHQGQMTMADRAGHVLCQGALLLDPPFPGDTATFDNAKPPHVVVTDAHGNTLWAGKVISKDQGVTLADGSIRAEDPTGQIVWEQPQPPEGLKIAVKSAEKPRRLLPEGTIQIHLVPSKIVYTLDGGKTLTGDNVFAVTFDVTEKNDAWLSKFLAPPAFCPCVPIAPQQALSHIIYDNHGRVLYPPASWQNHSSEGKN